LALDWYDTLLVKQGPNLPYVHYNKGYIEMLDYQNYDTAMVCFARSLQFLPEYAEAYANLGFCYEQKKQFGLSRENYQKAIELNPNLEPALQGLKRISNKK
jgi:tetratricopeptide (TPR) repeat protein